MGAQPFPGAFFDQQVDEGQPLGFVDRFGQQVPIAVVVKSLVLLTHLTPRALFSIEVFISPQSGAIVCGEHLTLQRFAWSRPTVPCRFHREPHDCALNENSVRSAKKTVGFVLQIHNLKDTL
jgi:hypothetical protein